MYEIQKLSILSLVMYFFIYLIIHIILGYNINKIKEELKIKPGNLELEKKYKTFSWWFKWFPACYVVFIVLMMYFM